MVHEEHEATLGFADLELELEYGALDALIEELGDVDELGRAARLATHLLRNLVVYLAYAVKIHTHTHKSHQNFPFSKNTNF